MLFSKVISGNKPFDASGIPNPAYYEWEMGNGIYYPSEKLPVAIQLRGEYSSRRVWINGKELLPGKSQKIINHSPDGFAWGYGGSGPAQLAAAICLELYGNTAGHQEIKWNYIVQLPQGDFERTITIEDIF